MQKKYCRPARGPGLITGASDDDPSGIATYSQVGPQFGTGMLRTMSLSYPLMAAIQEISGRTLSCQISYCHRNLFFQEGRKGQGTIVITKSLIVDDNAVIRGGLSRLMRLTRTGRCSPRLGMAGRLSIRATSLALTWLFLIQHAGTQWNQRC